MKTRLRFNFDSVTCPNYPFFGLFLSVGNLKWFFSRFFKCFFSRFFSIELGPRFSIREKVFPKTHSLENSLRESISGKTYFYTIASRYCLRSRTATSGTGSAGSPSSSPRSRPAARSTSSWGSGPVPDWISFHTACARDSIIE